MAISIYAITLFPEMFLPALQISITGRALEQGLLLFHTVNPREYSTDKHKSVDDTPYGGGSGMVMRPEPIVNALEAILAEHGPSYRILLSPSGSPLNQSKVKKFAAMQRLILVCGRYEGMDERICNYIDEEISIGDFILSGGELAALSLIDAVTRLQPGALLNQNSIQEESFEDHLLEYPQYTRPLEFRGQKVPDILLSGHHEKIRLWRRQQSLLRTKARRPDLFTQVSLFSEDRKLLNSAETTEQTQLKHPLSDRSK